MLNIKETKMDKQKLTIVCGNNGDISVGIYPFIMTITIEANTDLKEALRYITLDENNKQIFAEDIGRLALWFDEIKSYIDTIEIKEK